ncbi:MAG: hypothetical protein SFY69_11300 [Planctomycetota bacterium]|nr:hypothetical protein [Planctomycetota bacterium]
MAKFVLLGDVTEQELSLAPEPVRGLLAAVAPEACVRCTATDAVALLTDSYLAAGVVGRRWRADAIHVATATVHRADVLVSWNFRHLVNFDRMRGFNAVNGSLGYAPVFICSPAEVRYGREDKSV